MRVGARTRRRQARVGGCAGAPSRAVPSVSTRSRIDMRGGLASITARSAGGRCRRLRRRYLCHRAAARRYEEVWGLTRTWLSSPPVARRYAWAGKCLSEAGRAFLKGTGWKSHVDIGLESCQRISSVRTRMVTCKHPASKLEGEMIGRERGREGDEDGEHDETVFKPQGGKRYVRTGAKWQHGMLSKKPILH